MTTLEELWDNFPVRRPATADLVRTARLAQAARRRRLILRPVAVGGVAAGLVTAFALGSAVTPGTPLARPGVSDVSGQGGTGGSGVISSDASPVSFVAGLKAPSSCEALLASYKSRGIAQVTAWGWVGRWTDTSMGRSLLGSVHASMPKGYSAALSDVARAPATSSTTSKTGTNVQEAGVDEPDLVKSDGQTMVRIHNSRLDVFDLTGSAVERVGTLRLRSIRDANLLLSGSTVVVLGTDTAASSTTTDADRQAGSSKILPTGTRMITVSLADPAAPRVETTTVFSSNEITARQSGSTIRLVLTSGLPNLRFTSPSRHRSEEKSLAHNRAVIRNTTLEDWLPTYDNGSGATLLLDCDAVAIPDADAALGTVAVVGFDAAAPTQRSGVGIAANISLTYQSDDRLYLAGSTGAAFLPCGLCDFSIPRSAMPATTLFAFTLDGTGARHIASGTVAGYLRDRWSMDSVGDTVRLALSSSESQATEIDTFRVEGTSLERIGRLGGIGAGETMKSVRWFDDLALVVTYRETDPLFAISLTDPEKPREISHLKALGYSTYLHPVGDGRILGMGVTGILGRAKATLFDVSNLEAMREAGVVRFDRDTYASVEHETHAFAWYDDQQTALTSLENADGSVDLAVIQIDGSDLEATTITLQDAGAAQQRWSGTSIYDAGSVRTVESADGRIVVITPTSASYLTLPQ